MIGSKSNITTLVARSALPQLAPDLRLIKAVSEFAQALNGKEKQEFRKIQVQYGNSPPTASDVIKITEELNREGARRHASWTPATGTRLGGFLSRLQKFAEAGDVLIGGSQSLIASGVWTALRVSLEAVVGHYAYFDQISSLLMNQTKTWSITSEFAKHFPNSVELQALFTEYLIRVVHLCQHIIAVSKRPSYLLLASSLFSTFDSEFGPIQEELNIYGGLIEKQFALLTSSQTMDGQQAGRKETRGMLRRFSKSWKRQYILEQKQRLLHHLSPRQNQQDAIWRRERKRGTASWILTTPDYKSWKLGLQPVLRVTGHLGCGKTVALASIMADAPMEKKTYAGFICKRDDPNTLEGLTILGSIAHQLMQSSMVRQQWETLIQRSPDTLLASLTASSILQLLQRLLPKQEVFHVILDGLEECADHEAEMVLQALQEFRKSHHTCVCFSTRLDASGLSAQLTQEYLGTAVDVSLNNAQRDAEIGEYITSEVQRRNAFREPRLNEELVEQVTTALTVGAQGMYLWVTLQLEAIFPLYNNGVLTDESVRGILHHLPEDLPQAFEQALSRISDRRYSDRIFQLVAAAEVAEPCLTGEQLNIALTVRPGEPTWDGSQLPHNPNYVVARCGGGLLEIDEEDNHVRFIHHSVLSHLAGLKVGMDGRDLTRDWIADAEAFMGSVCVTYLNFREFDRRITLRKNIDPKYIAERLKKDVSNSNPILANVVRHLKGDKKRRVTPEQLNIFPILLGIQTSNSATMMAFLPYAAKNWIRHTARLREEDGANIHVLWRALVGERPAHAAIPWNASLAEEGGMLEYAFNQSHEYLLRYITEKQFHGLAPFADRLLRNRGNILMNEIHIGRLDEMKERCLVAGPSFIIVAYIITVLQICWTVIPWYRTDHIDRYLTTDIKAESMVDNLWALINGVCGKVPTPNLLMPIDAASNILESLRHTTESPVTTRKLYYAFLKTISKRGDDDLLRSLWAYGETIINWGDLRQHTSQEVWLLQHAVEDPSRVSFSFPCKLIRKGLITNQSLEQTLQHTKDRVQAEYRPIFDLILYPLQQNEDFRAEPDTMLSAIRNLLRSGEHQEALAMMDGAYNDIRKHPGHLRSLLNWIVAYRSDQFLEQMPSWFIREAVLYAWPTAMIDSLITFAKERRDLSAGTPMEEVLEREKIIFLKLFTETEHLGDPGLIERADEMGWTPLHAAALWHPLALEKLLPKTPENVNKHTRSGLTPLAIALSGHLEANHIQIAVKELLKAGADPNLLVPLEKLQSPGNTPYLHPLQCAVIFKDTGISHMLAVAGAHVKGSKPIRFLNTIAFIESCMTWGEDDPEHWEQWMSYITSLDKFYAPLPYNDVESTGPVTDGTDLCDAPDQLAPGTRRRKMARTSTT